LREKSKKELGDLFSIKEFHNTILKCGAVPLDLLRRIVEDWIKEKKRQK
jgi:uncharacterized protein (DUF885 family)